MSQPTDTVRHKLSFTSAGSGSPVEGADPQDEQLTASHYQTRAQQKTIDTISAQICLTAKLSHNQYAIEKECHQQRMAKLREILDEEKAKDWLLDQFK